VLPPCLPNRPNPPVHIHYPLAVLPDAQEYSFDVQLQQLMDRKRKLAHQSSTPIVDFERFPRPGVNGINRLEA
jgi:hypothetical protein